MNSGRKTKQIIAQIIHRYRTLLSVVAFVALIWGLTLYQKAPSSGGPMSFVRLAFADVGGPDALGYTLIDSDEPGGPVYNFEDISGTGTPINLGNDQVSGPISIGFTFNYYCAGYTQVYVSSNGFITALSGQGDGCCTGRQLPDNAYPHGTIAGWWEDLVGSSFYYFGWGGTTHYQTLGTPPNRRFIVQFKDVPHFVEGNPVTLQWKLFESTDVIEVHYKKARSDGGTHSAGIENQSSTVGLNYYTGTSAIPDNTAVRYNPPKRLVETATGTGVAEFWSDKGVIEDLTAVAEGTLPTEGKPGLDFPHGFFSLNITGLTPCATVVVTITLPSNVPVGTQYWKYHVNEGGWIQIPMGSDDGDNVITITLVDGGLGDDDGVCDGVIVDDGGPGQPPPVGGIVVPVNKLELLAPWMGMAALASLAALTVVLVRRRRG